MSDENYLFWEKMGDQTSPFRDSGGLAFYEGSILIVTGGGTVEYTLGSFEWDESFYLTSPLTGKRITLAVDAVPVGSGEILYIKGATFPVKDESLSLTAGDPKSKDARNPTNIFFGCERGGSIYYRPDVVI